MADDEERDERWTITVNADNPRCDGEYKFAMAFNGEELHLIKEVSGVRAFEMQDAVTAGDYDLWIAFAMIALQRNGKGQVSASYLRKLPMGGIVLDVPEYLIDEDPMSAQKNEGEPQTEKNEKQPSSGQSSNGHTASPVPDPPPIGHPRSATTAASDPATSAL